MFGVFVERRNKVSKTDKIRCFRQSAQIHDNLVVQNNLTFVKNVL